MKIKPSFIVITLIIITSYLILKDHIGMTELLPPDVILPDNSRYFGETQNGLFHGKGELKWSYGARYKGEFKAGLMSGLGEIWEPGSLHYKGQFKAGMMDGVGRYEYGDGTFYEGEFTDNLITGTGVLKTADQQHYEGVFEQGVLVQGLHLDHLGNRREGDFKNWLLSGFGSYVTEYGDEYRGQFQQGILNGSAEIKLADGSHFKGSTQDWQSHGEGQLVDAEGNQYQGAFQNGVFHGQGTLKLAEPIDGVSEISGQWEYGLHPDDPRAKRPSWRSSKPVDDLLYRQNKLINTAISQLSMHNADTVDMYYFSLAAHNQPVFYKEVTYIDDYFKSQYGFNTGSKNHSMAFYNHPDKSEKSPLVTMQSIQMGLDGLAEKMNPEQDILFIYLTSHGVPLEIATKYSGLNLADIDAESLGILLNKHPIKHKVIMLSACYSGSFIPYLENDHHLIMTAARGDRVSFGCGDGSEMTYFAQAMFKESLPNHDTFIAAFEAAKVVIDNWENKDFPDSEHSEPQFSMGQKIKSQLSEFRAQGQNQ